MYMLKICVACSSARMRMLDKQSDMVKKLQAGEMFVRSMLKTLWAEQKTINGALRAADFTR